MADALLTEDQLKKEGSSKAAENTETDGAAKEGENEGQERYQYVSCFPSK